MNAWSEFIRNSPGGEVVQSDDLLLATNRSQWPGMNLAFLQTPLASEADLRNRVHFASQYFQTICRRWLLVLYCDWAEKVTGAPLTRILASNNVYFVQEVAGMWAERLAPPTRKLPELNFRSLESVEVRADFARVNSDANSLPQDWTEEAVLANSVWSGPSQAYVGYQDGEPVTTAMTLRGNDGDFVGWVATRKSFQRSGFGEAIMRHVINAAKARFGSAPSLLHSTFDGIPLYRRLGFRECARFQLYLGGNSF